MSREEQGAPGDRMQYQPDRAAPHRLNPLDLIQNLLRLLTNLSISGLNARILAPIIAYGLQMPCRKFPVLPSELLDKLAQPNDARVQLFLKHIQGVQSRTANGLKQLCQPACLARRREQIYK